MIVRFLNSESLLDLDLSEDFIRDELADYFSPKSDFAMYSKEALQYKASEVQEELEEFTMLDTLIDLAKPGVWKDKLMIASEKLYDDDYKYIYLKAVVEVLSELDEEWGRYAREVYLVDYEGDDIVEACFRICKAVVHAYMLETNYSGRLDNIRIDLCQKSQYVIDRDSSEERLLSEINKLKFYAGENIFDDWKRYCKLAQAWYLYYAKYGKNKSGESMMKSVLLQAFTRQKADSYIECLCPSSSGRSSRNKSRG